MKTLSYLTLLLTATTYLMADPPVEVVGFQLISKAYGEAEFNKLAPFSSSKEGLEIALGINLKGAGIIAIDSDKSVVVKFTDDKGTNLAVKEFGREGFGPFPKASDDHKYGLISLASPKLPAAGATKVMASGKISLTSAATKKTERTKVVALKKDATFTLGKTNFKILKAEPSGDEVTVELETNDDVTALAEIRFLGDGNAKLETDRRGTSSMGFGGKRTTTMEYSIKGAKAQVIVEADVWQDAKQQEVPFDITVMLPVATSK